MPMLIVNDLMINSVFWYSLFCFSLSFMINICLFLLILLSLLFLLIKCLTIQKKRIAPIKGVIAKKLVIKENQKFVCFSNNLLSLEKDHFFETNILHDVKNIPNDITNNKNCVKAEIMEKNELLP